VYSEVNEWNPVLSTELHFNSYTFTAQGSEVLSSGTDGSVRFAQETQLELVRLFNRNRHGDRGIKIRNQKQRGGSSLFAGIAPAILVEPFFGSNRLECQMVDIVGKEALARAYLKAAQHY
jgi:N-acetylmuramoyl-L-alanine amidase